MEIPFGLLFEKSSSKITKTQQRDKLVECAADRFVYTSNILVIEESELSICIQNENCKISIPKQP